MIGALNRYGALSTKVRAMYGNRLRASDFQRIAGMGTLPEVLDYLRILPGWDNAVNQLDCNDVRRSSLELALHDQFRAEYLRLSAFIPREDKTLIAFPVMLAEQNIILTALRRLQAGHVYAEPLYSREFMAHAKIDVDAARSCQDYDGLLQACQHSLYYPALLHLRPEPPDHLPNYTTAEVLLRSTYFGALYRQVYKNYTGETQKVLLRTLGEQVDLLNIIHILRLKKFFPTWNNYLTILFPFNYRLRPAHIQALCAAPNMEAALALLQETPYAKAFQALDVTEVEDYYRRAFYTFNRKQLVLGTPSIYSAVAYLNLKEFELKALITAIESVKYGVPYQDFFPAMVGDA